MRKKQLEEIQIVAASLCGIADMPGKISFAMVCMLTGYYMGTGRDVKNSAMLAQKDLESLKTKEGTE
jgi:hypothetical protein